jgi:hypothetical protein
MKLRRSAIAAALATVAIASTPALAGHVWGGYHWARTTAAPFTVTLAPTWTDAKWGALLGGSTDCTGATETQTATFTNVANNWGFSSVPTVFSSAGCAWTDASGEARTADNPVRTRLAATIVNSNTAKRCAASSGIVVVCDAAYGKNGWLGLAQVWTSGKHITAGTAKMNDSYMSPGMTWGTVAWRTSVMCQEIGHTFGLGHQSENGQDLDTCMDYSSAPNPNPDQHDYNVLGDIYKHADSTTTLATSTSGRAAAAVPPAGGGSLRRAGTGDNLWVADLGNGVRRHVHVRWADETVHHGPPHEG